MDIITALELLDYQLGKMGIKRSFTICNGASLILQGIVGRETKDIDILTPKIDDALKLASLKISNNSNINDDWLNNASSLFSQHLKIGWEQRATLIFNRKNLKILSVSREDLLNLKFWAYCDRISDIEDIIALSPSKEEILAMIYFVKNLNWLKNDSNWHQLVDELADELKKEFEYA